MAENDDLIRKARRGAARWLSGLWMRDPDADAAEFERLSRESTGDSHGQRVSREDLHERR